MRPSTTAAEIKALLCKALANDSRALGAWPAKSRRLGLWTIVMTDALVSVARHLNENPAFQVVALGHPSDRVGKREHLKIDVVGYTGSLTPIEFAAEHENTADLNVLEYAAWKLLNVSAQVRVLVGYWDASSSSAKAEVPATEGELFSELEKRVVSKFIDRELVVLTANRARQPKSVIDLAAFFKAETLPRPKAIERGR